MTDYDTDTIALIGLIFIFIIFASVVVLMVIDLSTSHYMGDIETKCYDRYGNEILDQVCKQEVYCSVLNKWGNSCPIK